MQLHISYTFTLMNVKYRKKKKKSLKTSKLRVRECGWRTSIPRSQRSIPAYDALKDPFAHLQRHARFSGSMLETKEGMTLLLRLFNATYLLMHTRTIFHLALTRLPKKTSALKTRTRSTMKMITRMKNMRTKTTTMEMRTTRTTTTTRMTKILKAINVG